MMVRLGEKCLWWNIVNIRLEKETSQNIFLSYFRPFILQTLRFSTLRLDTLLVFSLSLVCVGAWIAAASSSEQLQCVTMNHTTHVRWTNVNLCNNRCWDAIPDLPQLSYIRWLIKWRLLSAAWRDWSSSCAWIVWFMLAAVLWRWDFSSSSWRMWSGQTTWKAPVAAQWDAIRFCRLCHILLHRALFPLCNIVENIQWTRRFAPW